jgi:hypothetical protein
MTARPAIVHLIGYPASGKLTISRAIAWTEPWFLCAVGAL